MAIEWIALIADMVASRELTPRSRAGAQRRLSSLLDGLNRDHAADLGAKFVVTLGDEFQAIIKNPAVIPDLIWEIETQFQDGTFRFGFGRGPLHTKLQDFAINVDGPAFHKARAAIDSAKKHNLLGGMFHGFSSDGDSILNGLARLLWQHRVRWKPRQLATVVLARRGLKQQEIARRFKITDAAVSDSLRAAAWTTYVEGETAFRHALAVFSRTTRTR